MTLKVGIATFGGVQVSVDSFLLGIACGECPERGR